MFPCAVTWPLSRFLDPFSSLLAWASLPSERLGGVQAPRPNFNLILVVEVWRQRGSAEHGLGGRRACLWAGAPLELLVQRDRGMVMGAWGRRWGAMVVRMGGRAVGHSDWTLALTAGAKKGSKGQGAGADANARQVQRQRDKRGRSCARPHPRTRTPLPLRPPAAVALCPPASPLAAVPAFVQASGRRRRVAQRGLSSLARARAETKRFPSSEYKCSWPCGLQGRGGNHALEVSKLAPARSLAQSVGGGQPVGVNAEKVWLLDTARLTCRNDSKGSRATSSASQTRRLVLRLHGARAGKQWVSAKFSPSRPVYSCLAHAPMTST